MSARNLAKRIVDRLPHPLPGVARAVYRAMRDPQIREAALQAGEQTLPLLDAVAATGGATLRPPPGRLKLIAAASSSAREQLDKISAALVAYDAIALIGDHPLAATLASRMASAEPAAKILHLAGFNDIFALRDRPDIKAVAVLCHSATRATYLRALVHAAEFKGDVLVPARQDVEWPSLAFENPRPIVQCAYPCAGTNRFSPSFQKLLDNIGWQNVWFSPFMRNVHMLQQSKTASGYAPPSIQDADEAIYWRARTLDQVNCLTIHEWVSLRRLKSLECSFVVLMRDPRDIINSYFWHTRKETNLSDEAHLLRIIEGYTRFHFGEPAYHFHWPDAGLLVDSYLTALDSPNMYIIRFEDLHADGPGALKTLMVRLGLDPSPFFAFDDKAYEDAAYLGSFEYQTGGTRKRGEDHKGRPGGEHSGVSARKGIVGDWRSSFTPAAVGRFKALTGDALVRLGYEKSADWQL